MNSSKLIPCVWLLMFALAPTRSEAKTVTLALSLFSSDGCSFFATVDSDPSWKNLKEVKVNGATKFRHDKVFVDSYPEEIKVNVVYGSDWKPGHSCALPFDPVKVVFSAAWRNPSRTLVAKGVQMNAEWHDPGTWCELRCSGYWTYTIRVDSENIPITDELVLTVHAEDGRVVSSLAGRLEPIDRSAVPTLPLP